MSASPFRGMRCARLVMSLAVLMGMACAAGADAAEGGPDREAIIDLAALDLSGRPHSIGQPEPPQATVLVFLGAACPVSRHYVPELNRLAANQSGQPFRLLGVISDRSLTRAQAVAWAAELNAQFPILFDASGELAEVFAPTHLPQAFLLRADGSLAYRGRIDDQFTAADATPAPAEHRDLADAIEAVLAGQSVERPCTEAVGCRFQPAPSADANEQVTYARQIAPIVYGKCVECHRPGEVAPFSLLGYDDVAKRAAFVAEVTSSRLMPPWQAEVGHGDFLGQRRLTPREIELFSAWAKAGAPLGDADDLPPQPQFASGWRLGEPDLVLTAPSPFTVPAEGDDVFQHFVIPIDIPEDKTVVGFEFRPGNPAVVHHAILFLDTLGAARRKDAETPEPGYTTFGSIGIPVSGLIGVWTPGMTPRFFPTGIGMPIRPGTDLVLQLHLHPSGKEESDQSSIALYFADRPAERRMAASPFVIGTILLDIPAGSSDHQVDAAVKLPCDLTLVSVLPHMHLVGKEMKVTATLPDGQQQSLIWIKDWNFYWQDNYVYRQPLTLPAGTELAVMSRYDNSADNPRNPSRPPARVLFGNDSVDEMCFGIFQVVANDERDERKMQMALMQSFMKQWNDSTIAPDARAVIIEEAGKLFGADRGDIFQQLLHGGGQRPGRRARPSGGD